MRLVVSILLALCSVSPVNAIPIEWTLENVQFDDGGSAYGSFTFDADLNQLSNVNVVTTAGASQFGGVEYDICHINFELCESTQIFFGEATDPLEIFNVEFGSPLTNSGGTIAITGGLEGNFGFRAIVGGQVSAVPLPATFWLFSAALAGLGWYRKHCAQ